MYVVAYLLGARYLTMGAAGRWHSGIFIGLDDLGPALFAHNSKSRGGVRIDTERDFSGGNQIYFSRAAKPGTEEIVVQRALSKLGTPYDLTIWNCEHFVNYAQTGQANSEQLKGFVFDLVTSTLSFGGLALLGWMSNNGRR
jgi:hypothetical protein